MPKLGCPCGFVHNLSRIPDDGWITIADREYEEFIDTEVKARQGDGAAENSVGAFWGSLYECPECGRIMWQKSDEDKFTIYRRDE